MERKRTRSIYLYLFKGEAALRKAMRMYDLDEETCTDIWASTFKVQIGDIQTYAIYTSRISYWQKYRPSKWWDIGAIAIWEVEKEDLDKHTATIKFVQDWPGLPTHQRLELFDMVTKQAEPDVAYYSGRWFNDRFELRVDRAGVNKFLQENARFAITGAPTDLEFVEDLATLHSLNLPREYLNPILDSHGALLTEIARYLNAVRLPMEKRKNGGRVFGSKFHIDEQVKDWEDKLDDPEFKLSINDLDINPGSVFTWAQGFAQRHCVDIEVHTILTLVNQAELSDLFLALDEPIKFVRDRWYAPDIHLAYTVRDHRSGEWFLIYPALRTPLNHIKSDEVKTLERKLDLPEGHIVYEVSRSVTIKIPANCAAMRCYDEHDAKYRLAQWYADQLQGEVK